MPDHHISEDRFANLLASQLCQSFQVDSSEIRDQLTGIIQATRQGHSCTPLSPDQTNSLLDSGIASTPEYPLSPIILDGNLAYLGRLFHAEIRIADNLLTKARLQADLNLNQLTDTLASLYPPEDCHLDNPQYAAAYLGAQKRLLLLSGGPGTGKTTTVIKILAALVELNPAIQHIILAAPTGKAAARLEESIQNQTEQLPDPSKLTACLQDSAMTLHRLLGIRPEKSPHYHADNLLPTDVLVVDEASMIDLSMFCKLLDALSPSTTLIIIGDRNQLASVETGSVFGDLCQAAQSPDSPLSNNLVELTKSYRFDPDKGIGKLARASNDGNAHTAIECLSQQDEALNWLHDAPANIHPDFLEQMYLPVIQADSPASALHAFTRAQILTPLRIGADGVNALNQQVDAYLQRKGLASTTLYHGCPILIRENHPSTGLFNGDIGILWADENQHLYAWFDQQGELRRFPIARLPKYEKAWAMTIHASQGSEYQSVYLHLPNYEASGKSGFTRELFYTAVTRARSHLTLRASEASIRQCLSQAIRRTTGLTTRLNGS